MLAVIGKLIIGKLPRDLVLESLWRLINIAVEQPLLVHAVSAVEYSMLVNKMTLPYSL